MPLTLYRKYRPSKFSELVGQEHIKLTLLNEISSGRITHAYLFSGPRGTGKTTTARLLAKAINCKNAKKGEPCNKCDFCELINADRSLNIIEIDAASHTGVDNVRENIIENSRVAPTMGKYKVFIIDESHMLSLSAFNALLKTLEEPPAHAVFILATTKVHKLPETIISRCQRFDFKKVNAQALVKRLASIAHQEKIKIDKEILENIAYRSEGCVRDAESLLGQVFSLGSKKITKDEADLVIPRSNLNLITQLVDLLINREAAGGLKLVNKLQEEGVELDQFTRDLIEYLRKIVILKILGDLDEWSVAEIGGEQKKKMLEQADKLEIQFLLAMMELFMEKERELKFSVIPQLPLEVAILKICQKTEENLEKNDQDDTKQGGQPAREPEKFTKKNLPNKSLNQKNPSRLNLAVIQKIWPQLTKKIKEYNPSLLLVLKMAEPFSLKDDVLEVGLAYKFHQERITQSKNKAKIEEILSESVRTKLIIKPVLKPELAKKLEAASTKENLWESVLKTFGGKVVKEER